jgi:signal transduction histidine kinase
LRVHLQPKVEHDGEHISGFQGAGQDITEYKRIEEQMIRRERLAAMGQIAATLAHEVKNPLQAIQTNLDLLGDFPLEPDERAETLAICRDEVRRLIKITQNILSVSRVDPEAQRLLSIGQVWQSALNLTRPQVRDAGIELAVALPATLPKIRGSMEQLSQVMLNLLLNAIENMPGGGLVTISGRRQGNQVAVMVTNDGPPIPDQILDNLFEPFVTTKAAGTGLGLFVSQTILHQHNGALTAKNLPEGRGVRFTFTLPIATEDENP